MPAQVVSPRMAPFEGVRIGIGPEDLEAVGRRLGAAVGRADADSGSTVHLPLHWPAGKRLEAAPVLVRVIGPLLPEADESRLPKHSSGNGICS